jgi:hypothetical protein
MLTRPRLRVSHLQPQNGAIQTLRSILTCLSFYYEGLSLAQFKQAFEQLAKSNEPSIEYSLWVAEGVPEGLKNYNAVNVEDSQQLRELHYYTR